MYFGNKPKQGSGYTYLGDVKAKGEGFWFVYKKVDGDFCNFKLVSFEPDSVKANYWITYLPKKKIFLGRRDFVVLVTKRLMLFIKFCEFIDIDHKPIVDSLTAYLSSVENKSKK